MILNFQNNVMNFEKQLSSFRTSLAELKRIEVFDNVLTKFQENISNHRKKNSLVPSDLTRPFV